MQRAVRLLAGAALLVGSACGGDAGAPPTVTPPAPVATVDVSPSLQTITAGQSATLAATLRDANGVALSGRSVSWSSSAPLIASVSPSGVVSALSSGTATITATAEGKTGSATIVVPPVVVSLFIDSIQPRLWVGRSAQLSFQVRDPSGFPVSGRDPQWTSSAPGIVAISNSGMLTGVAPGIATITGVVDGRSATRVIAAMAIPPAVIALNPESATIPRTVDYPLTARVADIDGNPVSGYTVSFVSADASIATVSAQGVVHPVANGFVAITALLNGQPAATSRIAVVDPRTVSGVVLTADGGRPTNLAFVARFGLTASAQRFVAPVDSITGAFTLVVPTFGASGPTIEYFIDVASGTSRRYHASYVALANGGAPVAPRIMLIPHMVTPDSGTYAGRPFAVDLNEAFVPVCTTTSDANCQSYWPSYWVSGIKNWADATRPIPLAFDRTPGTVAAADSVALWAVIRGLEADLGRSLFRPASFSAYTTTGYTSGTVLVSRDATVAPFVGYTNWSWDSQGIVYQARVRLASAQYFANSGTVSHEFTHAMGFSHTCRWSTVMGGYGCTQQARISPHDVAYFHLAEMVRRQVRALSPNWGIAESLQGDRVIELGMAAADAIPLTLRALAHRVDLPGADGAP